MSPRGALWPRLVLVAALLLLLGGLVQLFRARFDTGDIYPAYSSLRGDPLGTRVLFEALQATGFEVTRNFRDLERADPGDGCILFTGLHWSQLTTTSTKDVAALLEAVRAGARAVLVFAPRDAERESPPDPQAIPGSRRKAEREFRSLARELGLDARWLPAGSRHTLEASLEQPAVTDETLASTLPWRTALSFEPADESWRTLYSVGRYSAILERSFGDGSVLVLGDAYLVSNEAMVRDRHPGLLARVIGANRRVVFDETHLGVEENTGVAALARRYGLAPTALALLAVALLYLWRNGTSLVPPPTRQPASGAAFAGRDASAGLTNLLRRTVPPSDLLSACVGEYRRAAVWRRLPEPVQRSLETLAATASRDKRGVVPAIRTAYEILKKDH